MTSRYRLLAKWASGGMADVYVARHQAAAGFDKLVALKFLRSEDSSAWREMFFEEVRTTALLNHPNIVQTLDAGELDGHLFMAMEFVHGDTLGRFARTVSRATGAFPVELAIAIARDLASALEYAHTLTNMAGTPMELVHRDVSPSNILVSYDGMVKLLDFGVAKVATKLNATSTGMIKGKFSYMSPEQARGEPIDHRADIYSLGLVLWQLLTGKKANDADSDAALFAKIIAPNIPAPSTMGARCTPALDDIVMEALAPRAADRYASAGDLATALTRYLARHASGFDATKLIRALMVANFGDRRERLAELVKRSHETSPPLEDLESSLRSLSHAPSSSTSSQVAVPISTSLVDLRRRASIPLAALVLLGATAGGGYLAYRDHDAVRLTGELAHREPRASTASIGPAHTEVEVPRVAAVEVVESASPPVVDDTQPIEKTTKRMPPPRVVKPVRRATADQNSVANISGSAGRGSADITSGSARGSAARGSAGRGSNDITSGSARGSAGRGSNDAASISGARGSRGSAGSAGPESASIAVGSAVEPRAPVVVAKPEKPAATPPPVAPLPLMPTVREPGSFDATPALTKVAVDGSLPTSEVQNALERTTSTLRGCYRAAAAKAKHTPAIAIRISFVIDEGRAAHSVKVAGDTIGLAGCVQSTISNLRTRSAPDVGTVAVVAQISFKPVPNVPK